jgi:hypothetical protein
MVRAGVGRLPVVSKEAGGALVGIVTRSDLLSAHRGRLDAGVPKRVRRIGPRAAASRAVS